MYNQQQQQHLKSNNIISKLSVIVLSIVLLTGLALVPALQIAANGQSLPPPPQQQPSLQNQVGLSQVIKQIAQQVANANPGTNATQVYEILVQLAKQTAQTAGNEQAIENIRQIYSQVIISPSGILSQSLARFAQQIASGNGSTQRYRNYTTNDTRTRTRLNTTTRISRSTTCYRWRRYRHRRWGGEEQ